MCCALAGPSRTRGCLVPGNAWVGPLGSWTVLGLDLTRPGPVFQSSSSGYTKQLDNHHGRYDEAELDRKFVGMIVAREPYALKDEYVTLDHAASDKTVGQLSVKSSQKTLCEIRFRAAECGNGSGFRINVDTAIFQEAGTFSLGLVLRDCKGQFRERRVGRFLYPDSVFAAKARGVCEAIEWAIDKHMQEVTIKTDSLLTSQAMHKNSSNVLEVGDVLQRF
ncbi:hypothetical protein AgCh_032409 [Apium graveolens]